MYCKIRIVLQLLLVFPRLKSKLAINLSDIVIGIISDIPPKRGISNQS